MNNRNSKDAVDSSLLAAPHSITLTPLFPAILLSALALLLLGVLVFHDFLLGDKVLLYKDTGSDSLNDYFPSFVHISDYIRKNGLPSWSFCVGMGQNLFYLVGYLLLDPVTWLPGGSIPYALVFQHLAKILVAGLLFMRFLQLRGVSFPASLAGSLLLSFSAYMSMGSCWVVLADEVVCFAFLLWAVEQAVSRARWIYIPFAVGLISLVTVFHLYLCALLLCFYVPARLVELYGWKPATLFRICAQLAAAALLGIGIAAIIWFGGAYTVLNSPRGSGMVPNFALAATPSTPFSLESAGYYMTAALRPFSNDMIGTGDDFRGWENYLEAPPSYCGLLSLLLLPQVFIGATRRQRILYGLFLGLVIVPILFPWFRHLFWLFKGGYFRAFSLFSILGIITLSMASFSRYTERRALNLWVLSATLLVLLGVLYLPINQFQALIDPGLRRSATIFLVLYPAMLATGQIIKRQGMVTWMIVGLAAVEIIYFDRITVSNHPTVTKQELQKRVGYNDETVEAVREIKAGDNSFFRITKTWGSGPATRDSYNDAMVFGYYGTMSYSSFNNLDYIKFLIAVDAIPSADIADDAQWSPGLVGHPLLSTFACEKYVITTNPVLFETADHYEFIKRYGNIYLFRNKVFLPFGITFDRYLSEDVFLQLPSWAKPEALLHAVVLSDKDVADQPKLSQLSLDELKYRMSETSIPDALAERRATALDIRSFSETRIDGTVRLNERGILLFQMPFDAGWHAFIDGGKAPVIKVDAGLLGIVLERGEHTVGLRYRPPLLYTGAAVTLLSCCVLCLSLWRWPRIPNERCMKPAAAKTPLRATS